jgi:hypothetical protein
MVIIWTLFGAVLAITGVTLFRCKQRIAGGVLAVIGGLLVILGIIAWMSFHP